MDTLPRLAARAAARMACPRRPTWAGVLALAIGVPVHPEPYIALREGLKCSTCHVNHTGGGMRNGYGALFPQTEIAPLLGAMSTAAMDFSADVGKSLSLGADFIASNQTQLAVEKEWRGTGGQDSLFTLEGQNTFAAESGNLYLHARLIPGRLSLYLDETVAPGNAANREAVALLEGLPAIGYLKVGRMLLPYGIRMWDDDAFVRQVTGFNFDSQDLGVELGFEPGPLSVFVAASNGTQGARDDNRGKQVSAVASYWRRHLALGASAAANRSRGVERIAAGPFASLHLASFTCTGEVDLVRESGRVDNDQRVAFVGLEYWWRQAVSARLAFDVHDPYDGVGQDERSRLTVGLDAFLTPFLSASVHYRYKDSVPQDAQGNADVVALSLHTFF